MTQTHDYLLIEKIRKMSIVLQMEMLTRALSFLKSSVYRTQMEKKKVKKRH